MKDEMSRLPDGWQTVRLGDVCEKTKLVNPTKQPNDCFTYVDVSSVSNGSFQIVETSQVLGKDAPSRARKPIQTDDIIFATVRPTLKRVAIIPKELDGQVCSTGFCVVKTNKALLEPSFAYFYLLTEKVMQEVDALQKGATYPAINDSDLFDLLIPLPPLAEQRAIARALRSVQDAIEARRRETELERERKAALMQHLFTHGTRGEPTKQTEIGEMPESWGVVALENAFEFTKKPANIRYSDYERIPFVPMELIPQGSLIFNSFILKSNDELTSGTYFEPGDLLLAKITPSFENGKQGILDSLPTPFGIATTEIIPIKDKPEISSTFFLAYYLLRSDVRVMLASKMEGTTGRQRLSKSTVGDMRMPLPSYDEQMQVADVFRKSDSNVAALEREMRLLEELFRALLEELMTGRLSARGLIGMGESAMIAIPQAEV